MPRPNRGPQLRPNPKKGGIYYIFWAERHPGRTVTRERSTRTRNPEDAQRYFANWRPDVRRLFRSKKPVIGLIYFVRTPSAIKVGFAQNIIKRVADLQTANADELTFIGAIEGNYEAEKAVLSDLAEHRIRGEWFKDVPQVAEYIEKLLAERGLSIEVPKPVVGGYRRRRP